MTAYELPAALTLLLATLAALYTWRVLAFESVAEPMRKRLPAAVLPWLRCPFCVGFWIGAAWLLSALAWHDTVAWQGAASVAAAAYLIGHAGSRLDP